MKSVLVSTDDSAIAAEAAAHGAVVVPRPADLAGDQVSSEDALLHAVRFWEEQGGEKCEAIALLQATSPFTTSADIDRTMDPILAGEADSALTVVNDYGYFWVRGEGGWRMQYQVRARRQDRFPWKRESGNVYGIRRDLFLKTGSLFAGRVQAVTIPADSWLEIDEERELMIATALATHHSRSDESV